MSHNFRTPVKIDAADANPRLLLGLIGSGISQSLAGIMQEFEARHHDLRVHYQLIDLDRTGLPPAEAVAELPNLIRAVRLMGFGGLNITYPCKQAVIPLLDRLSDEAQAMGAVNVVTFDADGGLTGHNTDGPGWASGMQNALPDADLRHVVLMGCGGAGAAVAHAVTGLGAQRLDLLDTDTDRAQALANALNTRFGRDCAQVSTDARDSLAAASGFIHATPIGMLKSPGMPVPATWLHPGLWVADVVYVPLDTELLQTARALGCATVDGGHMNVGQGALGFHLFTGLTADLDRMNGFFRQIVA